MPHLGDKLKQYRQDKSWNQREMSDFLKIGYRTYQTIEKSGVVNKAGDLTRITQKTGIDVAQIIARVASDAAQIFSRENEEKTEYIKERRLQKNKPSVFLVPLVPVKAQAGYARAYSNTDFLNTLEVYPILPGINPVGAVWRYFEVEGDSMEPGLYERDLVLVSMVPHEDWRDVKKEQVYVIVTEEEVLIKLIFPVDSATWILRSSNKRHKDKKMAVESIKELWYFRRLVSGKLQWQKR